MLMLPTETLKESESYSVCLVLDPMELLRQAIEWGRSDLHVHITGAMIQVGDGGGLARMAIIEAVRNHQILDIC